MDKETPERQAPLGHARGTGPGVAVGQIWADNDRRYKGRTVRVVGIEANRASVQTVTGAGGTREVRIRKPMRILLNPHRTAITGYTLVEDVD